MSTYTFILLLVGITSAYYLLVQVLGLKNNPFGQDEIQTMQELHQGLQRMEKRIEALETIMLDRNTRESSTNR